MGVAYSAPGPGGLSGMDQDTAAALCAIGRQLAMRLDKLIVASQPLSPHELKAGASGGVPSIVKLLALNLASYPRSHEEINVTTAITPLVHNISGDQIAVLLTNNDNAQTISYGSGTVTISNGPLIQPKETIKVIVPPSERLYAVVNAGAVSLGVSQLNIPLV